MNRLLVVGGGFVGVTLAQVAEARGMHVTVLDRRRAPIPLPEAISWERADIRTIDDVSSHLRGHGAVVWCLRPIYDSSVVAQLSKRIRLAYISSLAVYDQKLEIAREDSALAPQSEYGQLKATEEATIATSGGHAVIVRSTGLYGAHLPSVRMSRSARPILAAIAAARAGERAVDVVFSETEDQYLHVADLSHALLDLVADAAVTGAVNVGPGVRLSVKDVAELLSRTLGIHVRPAIDGNPAPSPILGTELLKDLLPTWVSRPLATGVEQLLREAS
jgi:nucleoside-diphosphate-sugar epimerase